MTDDELRRLRARLADMRPGETNGDALVVSRALLAEVDRLRGAVLRPLDTSEVVAALHAGHVERRIAEGDNAWTSMQARIDALREALREACDGWRESYDAAGLAGDNNWPCGHDHIARLRKLGESR